jgi:hypothetical protein
VSAPSPTPPRGVGASPPLAAEIRLVGPAAEHARGRLAAPGGATFASDGAAYAVALGTAEEADLASLARALPDPDDLPPGTLVFVLPGVAVPASFASRVLAVLGRAPTVTRELRATALVARGYVRVAAGLDRASRSDLVWGYAPARLDRS